MKKYSKQEMEEKRVYELNQEQEEKQTYIEIVLEVLLQNTFHFIISEKRLQYVLTEDNEEYIYIKMRDYYENDVYYHRICITADSKYGIIIDFIDGIQDIWG